MNSNHINQEDGLVKNSYMIKDNGKEKLDETYEEFNQITYEISRESFDSYISYTAQTGNLNVEWPKLLRILEVKINVELNQMNSKYPELTNKSVEFNNQLNIIITNLKKFKLKPPFTIQRICEILIHPEKYYKSIRKLTFAFTKLVDLDE